MENVVSMDKAARRAEFVKDLRSGKFSQTTGRLRGADGYCCLGVACETYSRLTGEGEWEDYWFCPPKSEDIDDVELPPEVQDFFGFKTSSGKLVEPYEALEGDDDYGDLTQLNDKAGFTFNQIADVIENGKVALKYLK